jgi:hypothetical protein
VHAHLDHLVAAGEAHLDAELALAAARTGGRRLSFWIA